MKLPAAISLALLAGSLRLAAQPAASEVGGQVPLAATPPTPTDALPKPSRPRLGVLLATFPADPAPG